ncbi:septum formation initiator family protein [uncultured Pontibacter sp.]|uniref:FtsB family cell division protein n=1 Tax=uncultured Pontibacter sp. TaxID=453356 RepID=UPI002633C0BD|nr:septum formation initiator family protein [uncultured Pontibacter sp.]
MIKRIPKFFRNYYFITTAAFLVWMLFFDSNDFITQFQMKKELSRLESEKQYYLDRIDEVQKDRRELLSNQELLEKFAREKYLMKKPNEEVFIVVPQKED